MTAISGRHGALGTFASPVDPRPIDRPGRRRRVRHRDHAPAAGPHGDGHTGHGGHGRHRARCHRGVPHCPPDCGAVAAGDPLLVGFMTANPGVDWQAFPAADSQSYVNSLRRNTSRLAGTTATTNVAAAKWNVGDRWLQPTDHARLVDLAGAGPPSEPARRRRRPVLVGRRSPTGSPTPIPRIPGSVSGSCVFRPIPRSRERPSPPSFGATSPYSSRSARGRRQHRPPRTVPVAHQQYALHRGESPSRAVVSMSNGSCSGSASSPLLPSASWRAPAGEGAGGDPSWRSPRPSAGGRWPSVCPSWRWSAPWRSPCSIPPSCAGSAMVRGRHVR